ncbi:hypothetical protein P3L10_007324 [Capsicum annuum]
MPRARNSDKNASSAAVGNYSLAQGRTKRDPAPKKGQLVKTAQVPQASQVEQVVHEPVPQPMPTTIPAQIMMPPEIGKILMQLRELWICL